MERDHYCRSDSCFRLLYSNRKAKLLTAEALINDMDEKHIAKSVVVNIGWSSHEMCRRTNDYILESIARFPERLIGFCSVQLLETEKTLDEIKRCSLAGARGIGELRPDTQGYDLCNKKLMSAFVNCLIKRDMILMLHASEPVGHKYEGKGEITPGVIYRFIENNPDLKIILAHFGGGLAFYELMPEVSQALRNTYYDTAAAPFLYNPAIYNTLIAITGSSKILFGSDWPLLDPLRVVEHVRSANLEKKDINNILYKNTKRLLGI